MEKQKNEVISMLRSCLVSTKGRLTLRQLDNDFRTLVGKKIPYQKLGFKTLEELIQSEQSLIVFNQNGEIYVDAKRSEKTSHISEMVGRQKSEKKKMLPKTVRFNDSNYYTPAQTTKWRPKYINNAKSKKFPMSSRPAAVSHNQFISAPNVSSNYRAPTNHPVKRSDIKDRLLVSNGLSNDRTVVNNGQTISIKNNGIPPEELSPTVSSTRKRITKKMSELSMDSGRDSGNSSPTSEISFPSQSPRSKAPAFNVFKSSGDPIEDLKKFVSAYKVGELEVSSNKITKQKFFTCKIKVGKHTFTSYPQEFCDAVSAEKFCSEEALKDLTTKYTQRKSMLLSSNKDILERIPPMLEKHNHGIWVWQLEMDYADRFNEQLPVDWLKIIDSSPCIQVEKCSNNFVIRHCKPGDALQKGQKWSTFMNLSDVSVPSNTVQFGEDGRLFAEVTCVMSANEIWCRQIGTEEYDVFNDTFEGMEDYYSKHHTSLKADAITEGGYYVSRFDNGFWYRIRAVVVDETDVQCFFIDSGDEMQVSKGNIYKLRREFAYSQAQAFVCRLVGLEELYETSMASETLHRTILHKRVVLEIANDNLVDGNINDVSMPVYMNDYATGTSVNEELIPLLTIESASPTLLKESVTEVYVTNIESNGDVYVQIHSRGYDQLQELLNNLETEIIQSPPRDFGPVTKYNSQNRLYLAKYKVDSHWYRVQLIDWSPNEEMAQIYFVDYGNTDVVIVNKEPLYPLDKLNDVLSQYPFQAVKVRMAVDNIPKNFKDLAKEEMPEQNPVLLKHIEYDNENVPWVEFFKRNADGGLFCINKSIEMKEKLNEDSNNNLKSAKRKMAASYDGLSKNLPSGGLLPSPFLPQKNDYYEVHVPFAVNPWNFFVQPLKSLDKLKAMMQKLQDTYKDVCYSPLRLEDIEPGRIYASRHDDGYWYRTSVIKVINSGSISVFYCDFGYYGNLTVQQLIPLECEFMELPYQALKAKLGDIMPKQKKWTMEDCDIFKELVQKKHFCSVVMDVENDELYESDKVLKLVLVDTSSSDDDIYIGKELVKKGIAVEN